MKTVWDHETDSLISGRDGLLAGQVQGIGRGALGKKCFELIRSLRCRVPGMPHTSRDIQASCLMHFNAYRMSGRFACRRHQMTLFRTER